MSTSPGTRRRAAPTDWQREVLWSAITALALSVLVGLAFLLLAGLRMMATYLSFILVPLSLAALLSFLLDPLVLRLSEARFSRNVAILLVFLLVVLLLLFGLTVFVPVLVRQVVDLLQRVPDHLDRLAVWISQLAVAEGEPGAERPLWTEQLTRWLSASEGTEPRSYLAALREELPNLAERLFQAFIATFTTVAGGLSALFGALIVPVFTFYFLRDKERLRDHWRQYVPLPEGRIREEAIVLLGEINRILVGFFRGQLLVAFTIGLLTSILFLLIGVPYALLLGVLTGVLNIIPYFGLVVSLVPAIVLTLVQYQDWQHVAGVLVVFAGVQALDNTVISPKIMSDKTGLHPVVVVIALMFWGRVIGGLFGVVLAVPLTAIIKAVLERYVWRRHAA